jgi:hypothetical protein
MITTRNLRMKVPRGWRPWPEGQVSQTGRKRRSRNVKPGFHSSCESIAQIVMEPPNNHMQRTLQQPCFAPLLAPAANVRR